MIKKRQARPTASRRSQKIKVLKPLVYLLRPNMIAMEVPGTKRQSRETSLVSDIQRFIQGFWFTHNRAGRDGWLRFECETSIRDRVFPTELMRSMEERVAGLIVDAMDHVGQKQVAPPWETDYGTIQFAASFQDYYEQFLDFSRNTTVEARPAISNDDSSDLTNELNDTQDGKPAHTHIAQLATMLSAQSPRAQILGKLREQVVASGKELAKPLNDWIRSQSATTLGEKKAVAEFVNELLTGCGLTMTYQGKPCYIAVSTRARYPEGLIYLVPYGSKVQLLSRVLFADMPELSLEPKIGVSGEEQARSR